MNNAGLSAAIAVVLLIATSSAHSAPAGTGVPTEVGIRNSREVDFTSKVNGLDYRIQVALPFGPAPENGYPVIYVLDGYSYFASVTDTVRSDGNAPDVVVVGVGYPLTRSWADGVLHRHLHPAWQLPGDIQAINTAIALERIYDLTLPADDATAAKALPEVLKDTSADVGGADDFLKVMETEIKPRVQALARIDAANQILFGHSFGGLAALHALFVEPSAFRTFIIASPSISWNDRAVLKDEAAFAARVNSGEARPRVLLTAGGLEGGPSNETLDTARELAARLKSLNGEPPYEAADFMVFPDQDHGIAAYSALAAGVAFAFRVPHAAGREGKGSASGAPAAHRPAFIAAAIADASRPKDDVANDVLRDPADTLAFAGVKPGMTVAELAPEGGYYTRLLVDVVGPNGAVWTVENAGWADDVAADRKVVADLHRPNLKFDVQPWGRLDLPGRADLVWTTQNYHDLHIEKFGHVDMATFNRRVFNSLKPGGIYLIVDHDAKPGTSAEGIAQLHRIPKSQVIDEVTAAGFKLVAEGRFLERPADDLTRTVTDPVIRGRTSQFALKFVRP